MLEIRDLLDSTLGYITEYSDLQSSLKLDSWPEISFKVPVSSAHKQLLQNELRIMYSGEPYIIKSVNPSRDRNGGATLTVRAPSRAIELNQKPRQVVGTYIGSEIYSNWSPSTSYAKFARVKYFGVVYECLEAHTSGLQLAGIQWRYWTTCTFQAELAEAVYTATDMMTLALRDTGWTVGIVDDDGASRTFSGEWLSPPTLLQEIAEKFDRHLVYHGSTRVVDLVIEPGKDSPVTIEYGKNLTSMSKSADSTDFVTKLFVYGDEKLTFNEVNLHTSPEHPLYLLQDHQSFIFNFDYFLSQGYTLDQIYASWLAVGDSSPFFRMGKLELSDYIEPAALLAEGKKQLKEELSVPQVTYRVDFVDLAQILEDFNEDISLGDLVTVRDLELGVNIKVRVTGLNIAPGYPENSSAELSNKDDFFGNAIASSLSYTKRLSDNNTVKDLLRNMINTATTVINSSTGELSWKDGQLTAVDLDELGNPTGRQVRLTPGGFGVSTDFGATYENAMTGDGVLANKVVADSLHIMSVGADGIIIEPQTSGVRLNNTEGIIVQSQDKRFAARMMASNNMGGTSMGFSIWNGEYAAITIGTTTGDSPVFTINGVATTIPYVTPNYTQVGPLGKWYLFRKTAVAATGPGVLSSNSATPKHLLVDGVDTGCIYTTGQQVENIDGFWYVGDNTNVAGEYNGESLVFGVNMNGDAYFKGEVHATSGRFDGEVHATSGEFNGAVTVSQLIVGNVDILDFISTSIADAQNPKKLKIGNIELNGTTGDIKTTGNIDLGGNITLSGNITWGASNSPVRVRYNTVNTGTPSDTWGYATWQAGWTTAQQIYAIYSYNGGTTWGTPILVQGATVTNNYSYSSTMTRSEFVSNILVNSADGIYNMGDASNPVIGIRATALVWGEGSALGNLCTDTGMGSGGTVTTIAHIQSNLGMLLSANSGGLRLEATNGIYLTDPNENLGAGISVGHVGNWVSLRDLILSVGGSAKFT